MRVWEWIKSREVTDLLILMLFGILMFFAAPRVAKQSTVEAVEYLNQLIALEGGETLLMAFMVAGAGVGMVFSALFCQVFRLPWFNRIK